MTDSSSRPTVRNQIDYLARDYNSLRQLLLDHFALQIPDWSERHAADLGVTLVELLAYAGDYLSYYQDAVAAEAYLATARQRASLRRHSRLLDYAINEGVSARTFVHFDTAQDGLEVPSGASLLTETPTPGPIVSPALLPAYDGMVFEAMHEVTLFRAGNRMPVISSAAILPVGATVATLQGHLKHLAAGDVLLFEQDAAALRSNAFAVVKPHPVRLARPPRFDEQAGAPITSIEWFDDDALPAEFLLSARLPSGQMLTGLTVALGNNVLVQHGRTVREDRITVSVETSATGGRDIQLPSAGIAFGVPYFHGLAVNASAASSLMQDPAATCAVISLQELPLAPGNTASPASANPQPLPRGLVPSHPWTSRRDLLLSDRFSRDFVAEIDNNGLAHLRFGDGEYGRRPAPGTGLRVSYRVGLGSGGNVSAGAIAHVVTRDKGITGVRNPLAATGGLDPETASRIRIDAPQAFRTQRRCVTEQDYIDRALLYPEVGSAVASRTWSPSTSLATVTIHIARTDRNPVSLRYCERVRASLLPFAMIGDLLVVRPPDMLPMSLVVSVTTLPGYSFTIVKNQVYAAIDAEMSKTSYEFGQLAQSSRWLAIAAAVPGVDQVQVEVLPVRDSPTPVTAGQEMPTGSPQPSVVSPATIVRFENIQVLNGTPAAAPAAPLPATGVSAS